MCACFHDHRVDVGCTNRAVEVEFGGCRRSDEMFAQGDIRRQYTPEGALSISEEAGMLEALALRRSAADSGEGIIPAVNDNIPHEVVPSPGISM